MFQAANKEIKDSLHFYNRLHMHSFSLVQSERELLKPKSISRLNNPPSLKRLTEKSDEGS